MNPYKIFGSEIKAAFANEVLEHWLRVEILFWKCWTGGGILIKCFSWKSERLNDHNWCLQVSKVSSIPASYSGL